MNTAWVLEDILLMMRICSDLFFDFLPWLLVVTVGLHGAFAWLNRHVFHLGRDAFTVASFLGGMISGGIAFWGWLIWGGMLF